MMNAVIKDGWLVCGKCGHKFARVIGNIDSGKSFLALEMKCHSCKTINYINDLAKEPNIEKMEEKVWATNVLRR